MMRAFKFEIAEDEGQQWFNLLIEGHDTTITLHLTEEELEDLTDCLSELRSAT
jgi:hypothetical protein